MESPQFHIHATLEQCHWWFTARRRIVRTLIETLVGAAPGSRIVEVGCGTGGNIADFSAGYSCLGVDVNQEAIAWASERFSASKFVCGRAPDDVRPELHAAHAVLLLDVLEHVRDDFLLLSQLLAAMRPGAYLLITVPADPALWTEHDVSFGHFRRYDRARLEAVWEGLPVSCLLCSYFNSRLYFPIRLARQLNRRLRRTSGISGTDFSLPSRPVNQLLHRIFSGESRVLTHALSTPGCSGYERGVSLLAVLRRDADRIVPRMKPAPLEKDFFDPETGSYEDNTSLSKYPAGMKGAS